MSELKKLFHITPASETSCAGWFGARGVGGDEHLPTNSLC